MIQHCEKLMTPRETIMLEMPSVKIKMVILIIQRVKQIGKQTKEWSTIKHIFG